MSIDDTSCTFVKRASKYRNKLGEKEYVGYVCRKIPTEYNFKKQKEQKLSLQNPQTNSFVDL
jgi:hypothetical protein